MAKKNSMLADLRRKEQLEALEKLPDRDLCEAIRAHFESHPTLPGEKALKDRANHELNNLDDQLGQGTMTGIHLDPQVREDLLHGYAQTRIRETPLKEGTYYLDFRHFDPAALKREPIDSFPQQGSTVYVEKVNVELQNNGTGEVYVLAEQSDGGHRTIGTLPENFLRNNPMNVDYCAAELEVTDYSNGNLKNLSASVVVDTDVLSGDVIDLDEDMFAGLDQDMDLNQ